MKTKDVIKRAFERDARQAEHHFRTELATLEQEIPELTELVKALWLKLMRKEGLDERARQIEAHLISDENQQLAAKYHYHMRIWFGKVRKYKRICTLLGVTPLLYNKDNQDEQNILLNRTSKKPQTNRRRG